MSEQPQPQPQPQDLMLKVQEMMAQMTRMQVELDRLNSRPQVSILTTGQPKKEISTSRRKVLWRLAGGMVAGLAVGRASIAFPPKTEAQFTNDPTSNGFGGRIGMLVMPPVATLLTGPGPISAS